NDARRLRLKLLESYRQTASPEGRVRIDVPKGGYVPEFLQDPPGREARFSREGRRRLAVLPFEILSTSPESAQFGRALSLLLTAGFTSIDGLDAISHEYVCEHPLRTAVSELQLSHLISGGILRSDYSCRVIINLVQASSGSQLWAREYTFSVDDVLHGQ